MTCGWVGMSDEVLRSPHPFKPATSGDEIWGCPACKSVDSLFLACEHPGCSEFFMFGGMTENGWYGSCDKHRPEYIKQAPCAEKSK